MKPFNFSQGTAPLLLSIPHAGTALTPEVSQGLSEAARSLCDTDWHIPQLYEFAAALGASVLVGNYSRLVIDLNRPPDNQPLYQSATTGLYPETLFDGRPTFKPGMTPDVLVRQHWLETIWQPYHQQLQQELARLKTVHGYALLFDAHSIASVIPRLFAGKLPDLNFGTYDGISCSPQKTAALQAVCAAQNNFSWVFNGRFKGGYITRAYGDPARKVQALQLELAQYNYMEETLPFRWCAERASRLQPLLKKLMTTYMAG